MDVQRVFEQHVQTIFFFFQSHFRVVLEKGIGGGGQKTKDVEKISFWTVLKFFEA